MRTTSTTHLGKLGMDHRALRCAIGLEMPVITAKLRRLTGAVTPFLASLTPY